MKKIPTLFVRDPTVRKFVLPEITPGCEWVLTGEGVPTRKYDGTCVAIFGGDYFRRQERKESGEAIGAGAGHFVTHDPETGKSIYWVPVGDGPEDRWHRAGLDGFESLGGLRAEGTYELVGPKIQGNPEGFAGHTLIAHATAAPLYDVRRGEGGLSGFVRTAGQLFNALRDQLTSDFAHEGIVWHHPDGRMAKLKKRDFPR